MARGQAGAAEKELNKTDTVAAQQGTEAQGLEDQLKPAYTSLMNTGYMDPKEEAAATTSEMGSATAPFSTAKFEAANRAGATRNASDLTAQQDQLALDEGKTAGGAAAELQKEKMSNQEAGMYGLGQLEQGNLGAMEKMYGLAPGLIAGRAAGTLPHGFNTPYGGGSGCWIAAALYGGWDDPRTIDVRRWLNTEFVKQPIGRMVMKLYLRFGERIAEAVKRSAVVRAILRPLFDLALRKARG
jgi:hypothetical protein